MGSLSLTTAPTLEPIALQEAKEHCRIDIDDEDALIEGYITAARQHIEVVTGRALITQALALRLDGWPCWIDVPKPPLLSVTSITYVDGDGNTQTLAADQYRVDAPAGPTCARGRIEPAYGVSWPSVRDVLNSVTVNFSAGYGTTGDKVPAALRSAMLLLIGHWYEHREHVIVSQFSTTAATELPMAAKALWTPYKTWPLQRH